MIHEFHLSSPGKGGISCGEDGAFVGTVPILMRARRNGKDEWQPRDCDDLSEEMSAQYDLPIDMSSKRRGLQVIAKALNDSNVARAQVATVLLGIPDPSPLSKGVSSRQRTIKFIRDLHWSGLLKWDPDEHPRWPAGSADGKGGEFAPKGDDGEADGSQSPQSDAAHPDNSRQYAPRRDARIQLADAGMSDAYDDPIAEASRAAAPPSTTGANSQSTPVVSRNGNFWEALGSRLSHDIKSALSRIGRAEIAESDANLAVGTAEAEAIAHALKAYADYRARPWIGSDGRPVQVPIINTGDPLSDQAALMGHELFEPNAPLMRPATNADWIDPLVNLVSLGAMAVGPAIRLAGPATEVIDSVDTVALSANATGYRATFGRALTNDYRTTFFESNPELEGQVVVHHAVPQRTLTLYPDDVAETEIHSIENLRGIPNELNSDMHLSQIAKEWNRFYKANPNASQEQLLQKATEIDQKFGRWFKPPVGRGNSQ